MAEALIAGLIKARLYAPSQITVTDIVPQRLEYLFETYKVNTGSDSKAVIKNAGVVVIAVKPQQVQELLKPLGADFHKESVVISIAAGISIKSIENVLKDGIAVIRAMPNMPCLVGEGMTVLAGGKYALQPQLEKATGIFSTVGHALILEEKSMDAVTGLSGSGPAYVFLVIQALSDGGVKAGLPRNVATELALQTVIGAAKLMQETGKHPAELIEQVTSPGGTTIEGLSVLENKAVRSAFIEAVGAAAKRSKELAAG